MTARRTSLAFAALTALAACGDPFPEDFTIAVDGTTALGFAKVSEFSDADIQTALRTLCGGGVENYTTEMGTDGTKFFGANCPTGFNSPTGSIYVTRTPSGAFTYDLPS